MAGGEQEGMHQDEMPSTQLIPRQRRAPQPDGQLAYLQVLTGKRAGYVHRLDDYGLVMGRGEDCQLILDEPGVSRRHAQLLVKGEEHWLEDLGSTNGTFVNDEAIKRFQLSDGDRFELGTTAVKFGRNSPEELALAEKLYDSATRDGLTRALNRASFFDRLEQELSYCRRQEGRHLSLLMLDVDHFKKINDGHGHPAGDQVLCFLADLLRRQLRLEDVVGRYGGEEFAVMLRQIPLAQAEVIAERLRGALEGSTVEVPEPLKVTMSLGLTAFRPEDTVSQLVARADAALYRAKNSGRNRVEVD